MKHPYEAFGIVVAGACLVFVMAIPIGDFVLQEFVQRGGSGGGSGNGGDTVEYVPWVPPVYDNNVVDEMQDCKKASKDLHEFYDCVNG